MSKANYQTAADAFDGWRDDLLTGTPPKLYPIGEGELARIEVGPQLVTLFGGRQAPAKPPLSCKRLSMRCGSTMSLRAVVLNVEMPPAVLLDRQLARLSGIPAEDIRYRQLGSEHSGPARRRAGDARSDCRPARLCPAAVRPGEPSRHRGRLRGGFHRGHAAGARLHSADNAAWLSMATSGVASMPR